ncbi:gamma-glutamyltransferase [Erythrobacter arachoides]|uniref:Glutathione hydrolase proenzyme n=1 Tax=Aurantiacibacter arachoides TaxID=1850444 RepID=A0A845AAM4_9SPHN|nr:gamma-glutamyltransferase [Aurantiacibacter arachoides]MXO94609.1 gamma-glutamyltransferase [Aurantiacibacter arachoides]GGD62132.1 gamma-glutamyltransferase [Aurantiacibacter arachoides]
MMPRLSAFVLAPLLLGACTTIPGESPARTAGPDTLATGMVSAADPRAAAAGAQILRQGGSATDAAIAVMLALTVVEPQSSGIGGGGFYVHAAPDGTVETIDGRETAPAEAGPGWFLGPDGAPMPFMDAVIGGRSVGVPGNIALAALAHRDHGVLPWADLFAPAIALAREGWSLSQRGAEFAANARNRSAHEAAGRALFFDADGTVRPVGTRLTNPALADTLQAIAAGGPRAFYRDRAEALAQHVAAATPGEAAMRAADLQDYAAAEREPLCGTYRRYRICGMGPPSSGATTVLAILGQLERFDMAALGPQSATAWHLFAESQRLAYADRELYLADSDFVSVPAAALVDPDYLATRSQLLSVDNRMASVAAGRPGVPQACAGCAADGDEPPENGTSHFAVVDAGGNAVSYTSTIEGPFGSGLMFGGFYLNNELTDFSFSPQRDGVPVANRVEGGKRPRSSMAPTMVFAPDGRLVLAIGAAGGATIPVQVSKALIGYIDWGLSAQDAIALPLLFSPGDGVTLEQGSTLVTLRPALEALGHPVAVRDLPLKANAVEWRDGRWIGAFDPRSEGAAVAP